MDPKCLKDVKEVTNVMLEFLDQWSMVDDKLTTCLQNLNKIQEEEEESSENAMGYIAMIIGFRNEIELATKEARCTVEYLDSLINK